MKFLYLRASVSSSITWGWQSYLLPRVIVMIEQVNKCQVFSAVSGRQHMFADVVVIVIASELPPPLLKTPAQ